MPEALIRRLLVGLGRSLVTLLMLAGTSLPGRAGAMMQHYVIDQRHGDIEFSVGHLGLFRSHGEFRRFSASLSVNFANPPASGIDVDIDATSLFMPSDDAESTLRSSDYFDVPQYPHILFHSTAVAPAGANRYTIRGVLQIRGVAQSETLDAALVRRHANPAGTGDVADFIVTGKVQRSAFGMVSDQMFVSDTVDIRIMARIELAAATAVCAAPAGGAGCAP